jgi:hypothetical protein
VTLQVVTNLTNPVTQYQWDYDGNGVIDQTGSELDQITVQYQAMGIYYPTVTVTDTNGNTFTATTVVNVLSRDELDALLKNKWDEMKTALINKDFNTAIGYLTEAARSKYQRLFERFGDNLPGIAANLPDLQPIWMDGDVAAYYVTKLENGTEKAHYVYFVRDQNGLWGLQAF